MTQFHFRFTFFCSSRLRHNYWLFITFSPQRIFTALWLSNWRFQLASIQARLLLFFLWLDFYFFFQFWGSFESFFHFPQIQTFFNSLSILFFLLFCADHTNFVLRFQSLWLNGSWSKFHTRLHGCFIWYSLISAVVGVIIKLKWQQRGKKLWNEREIILVWDLRLLSGQNSPKDSKFWA